MKLFNAIFINIVSSAGQPFVTYRDLANSTVTVLGLQWQIRSTTELEDDSGGDSLSAGETSSPGRASVRGAPRGGTTSDPRPQRGKVTGSGGLRAPISKLGRKGAPAREQSAASGRQGDEKRSDER